MSRPIPILAVLVAAVAPAAACGPEPGLTDARRQAVADTVAQLTDAFEAAAESADPEAVLEFLAREEGAYADDGTVQADYETVAAQYRSRYLGFRSQDVALRNRTITVLSPDAAVVTAGGSYSAVLREGGEIVGGPTAWTLLWVREEPDGWKIRHIHKSYPGGAP